MTNRDPLTGAHDRTALFHTLQGALGRSEALALLLFDVDHFKSINDAFGHQRGDAALRALVGVAERALNVPVYRYAGDEFVALLPRVGGPEALARAQHLTAVVAAHRVPGTPPVTLSTSVGVAGVREGERWTPETLFEAADRAMYAAKRAGRGRAVLHDEGANPASEEPHDGGRLIERDAALGEVRAWVEELPSLRRALLAVGGPSGVGKSRFLREVERFARLRGFAALALRASPALGRRLHGALAEADWSFLGDREAPVPLLRRLAAHVRDKERAGLVLTVDEGQHLDSASARWLHDALGAGDLPIVGVAFSAGEDGWRPGGEFPEREVRLTPFSPLGTRSWWRSRARRDLPGAAAQWLHEATGGLPARLERTAGALLAPHAGGGAGSFAALRAAAERSRAPERAARLPEALGEGGFVGRTHELRQVRGALERGRLVSITGPGGIGKTRLAAQAAAELASRFADGAAFVPLLGERAASFDAALARALGLELPRLDLAGQVRAWLRDRGLLLVLDGFEPVPEEGGALHDALRDLLQRAPGVRVIVTSREALGVGGEERVELRGLPVDDAPPTDAAGRFGAVAFFLHLARRAAPDWTLSDEDRAAVRELCALVEGSPLALELAAAWLPTLGPAEIAAGVRRGLDFLDNGRRSLRALMEHFWAQLGDAEARAVRRLGAFRGPFTVEAARRVAGASPFLLAGLVSRAYLSRRGATFALHEFLRQDAWQRLQGVPEECASAQRALRDHYLRAALTDTALTETVPDYHAERDNHRHALDLALSEDGALSDPVGAARAVLALTPLLRRSGSALDALDGVERAAEHLARHETWGSDSDAGALREACLVTAGELRNFLGDVRGAQAHFERALHEARAVTPLAARAWCGLSRVAQRRGDFGLARDLGLLAVQHADATNDARARAQARRALGRTLLSLGERGAAHAHTEFALRLYAEVQDAEGEAQCHHLLGMIASANSEYDEANAHLQDALARARALGDRPGAALALTALGWNALLQGDLGAALQHTGASLSAYRELGGRWEAANALVNLGHIAVRQGDLDLARHHYREAAAEAQAIEATAITLEVLVGLAALNLRRDPRHATLVAATVAFALQHPGRTGDVERLAQPVVRELRDVLPEAEWQRAVERASHQDAQHLVRAQLDPSSTP